MKNASEKELPIRLVNDIPIFVGTKGRLLEFLTSQIHKNTGMTVIFTPNPEQIALSLHDPQFAGDLKQSTLNLPDGQGLVWALKRQGVSLERIPGRRIFHEFLVQSKEKRWRVLLLGGKLGSGERVAIKYNCLFDPGARDIRHETTAETQRILEKIKTENPKLLFVAFGAPWQERWILRHREVLEKTGVRLAMVVGGAIDYEAGLVPQVPDLFEKLHLEWLWRLIREPWRWRRQLRGLEFFWRVLTSS